MTTMGLSRPFSWLLLQAGLLLSAFFVCDKYDLYPTDPDNYWYEATKLNWLAPVQVLSSYRTFGYPFFLKCVHSLSPSFAALPACHLGVRLLSVFVFYRGLRCISASAWLALAVASSLLYTNAILSYEDLLITFVLSDSLGESLAILTFGTLLVVVRRPRSLLAWSGLGLGLFLTYQMRPVYQFLVVLLPLLGVLLIPLVSPRADRFRQLKWTGITLVGISVVPFLAFCTLRWVVVDHFGLVSYSGSSLVGIAGQFLTEDMVAELPANLRPLAHALFERRKLEGTRQLESLFGEWRPSVGSDNRLLPGVVEDDNLYMFTQCDYMDTARELCGDDQVLIDRRLTELSVAIIKARPRLYFRWLMEAFPIAIIRVLTCNYVFHWLLLLAASLLCVWLAVYVFYRVRRPIASPGMRPTPRWPFVVELKVMALLALGFALGNIFVIVPLVPPMARYLTAAGVFLSAVAALVGVALCTQIGGLLRASIASGSNHA